jgi:hypothetical protein
MRYHNSFMLWLLILVIVSPSMSQTGSDSVLPSPVESSTRGEATFNSACLPDSDILFAIQNLSSAQTCSEQQEALALLRADAKRSPICRKQIVAALMTAMDKPNLDLFSDRPSFYLWHYGSELLADLKAVEALDLLIAHLDLNDGTPFPLNHYPALGAVINMGEYSLPKLNSVLRQNPSRYMRRYAVFCIASIGGVSAKRVLQEALASESDQCITAFIKASLDAFNNKTLPDHITSENRTKWYATFLCNGE